MIPRTTIIDVAPKDIQFLIEFNAAAIQALMIITDNMTFTYDSSNPEHIKANEYLLNVFTPLIEESDKILKGGGANVS